MLEQELLIPNLFRKQGVDQFKGAENDTISMKVGGICPSTTTRDATTVPAGFQSVTECWSAGTL
ncbi:hypothetical protein [Streptomyces sp. NPDC001091]